MSEERFFFGVVVVSIVIGIVLALTGYEPSVGYGSEPPDETCTFDPAGQLECEEG
ncbi:MAG: hypothetical protein WBA97_18505 [Actinophytocola sp.]|uniref:hypothetical protein n=1 Tax=Actinophytocola sp. TaxID=1872138 RepID=UPI003C7373EA